MAVARSEGSKELLINLCYLIGEFASNFPETFAEKSREEIITDFYESLEVFVYEMLAEIKSNFNENSNMSTQPFYTRAILVGISALSKLSINHQPLTFRVTLCLEKILREKKYLHESVFHRAVELVNLLKYPR